MNMIQRTIFFICLMSVSVSLLAAAKLPKLVYQKLQIAHSLMDTEQWLEARVLLEKLSAETNHKYAQALIAQSQGQIAIHQENMALALGYFEKALELQVLDELANNQLRHSISQLHCSIEEWIPCREKMQEWMRLSPEKVKASDYIVLAQAYAATESWKDVIDPTSQALKLNQNAPKSWHQMLVVSHNNLAQWPEAISAQESLLAHFSEDAQEWRRLVSLHLNREDSLSALNSMRLPYERGLMTTESDVRQMTLLLYHADLPYQAARTLRKAMDRGRTEMSEKNMTLLAGLWVEAKSFNDAVVAYRELIHISPKRKWYKQLASLYFQEKNWSTAIDVIKQAGQDNKLELNEQEQDDLELMHGMALINLSEFKKAKGILEPLTNRESVKSQAENWLSYIAQLQRV